jgi:acetolactate synthase-1/2/3 large subunit
VVGDIAHTVERLTDALDPQTHWDFGYFDKVRTATYRPAPTSSCRPCSAPMPKAACI